MLLSRLHVLITGDNKSAVNALKETGDATESASSRMAGAIGAAGRAVAAVGTIAVGLGGVVAGIGLQQAAASEQASISFETMLGSAEAAEGFLGELKAFAATTPFEFPELQSAASSLVSAGVEANKVIPIMTTLGDVTSGMGTGSEGVQRATVALQQMSAAGKITGEDLAQLRDAGIPVFDLLAAATGKSKEEVVELANAGKLGKAELDQLMGALETGAGLERFSGLMEKQSQSLTGMISTLKDTLSQGLGDAAAPLVDNLKGQLPGITEALSAVMADMGPVFTSLGEMVTSLVPLLQPVAALVGGLATSFSGLFSSLIEQLTPVLEVLLPVFEELGYILSDSISEVLPEIGAAFLAIAEAIAPLLPQLLDLAMQALLPLVRIAAELITAVAPMIELFGNLLVPVFEQVLDAISPLLPIIEDSLIAAVLSLTPVIMDLITLFADLVTMLLPVLPPIVELTSAVLLLIGPLLELAMAVLLPLAEALMPIIELVATLATGLANDLTDAVHIITDALSGDFGDAFVAVGEGLADFVGWFIDLPGDIWDAIGNLDDLLVDAGKDILNGLLRGLEEVWEDVKGWFGDITDSIPDLKGPMELDMRLLTPNGKAIMGSLLEGLQSEMPAVEASLGAFTTRLVPEMASAGLDLGFSGSQMVAGGGTSGTVINMPMYGDIVVSGSDDDGIIRDKVRKFMAEEAQPLVAMIRQRAGVR